MCRQEVHFSLFYLIVFVVCVDYLRYLTLLAFIDIYKLVKEHSSSKLKDNLSCGASGFELPLSAQHCGMATAGKTGLVKVILCR